MSASPTKGVVTEKSEGHIQKKAMNLRRSEWKISRCANWLGHQRGRGENDLPRQETKYGKEGGENSACKGLKKNPIGLLRAT